MSRNIKLTKQEKEIEKVLLSGEFVDVDKKELEEISKVIARRKKDAVLNIRVNSQDLESIKRKAKKLGIKYQTFISELLHKVAL
ncbi:MAG: CopG family antitoxin [Candidatus Tritonobacter lacicola]|nr:CopG family antitoxin [Candidatus Tritonobacter lacicola]